MCIRDSISIMDNIETEISDLESNINTLIETLNANNEGSQILINEGYDTVAKLRELSEEQSSELLIKLCK